MSRARQAWVNPQGVHIGRGTGWPDGRIFTEVALRWLVHVMNGKGE
jgi:hypothetical protein